MQPVAMQSLTRMPPPASPVYVSPRGHHSTQSSQMHSVLAYSRPSLQLGQVGSAPAPAIAAAVANLISNASLRASEERPEVESQPDKPEETLKPMSQVASDAQIYNDRTTGLLGCPLTVPKYSQRLKGQSESPPPERRRRSPRPAPQKDFDRAWEKCHKDLYEDAFARQQRLKDMQSYVKQMEEDDQRQRKMQCQEGIKQRRRYYRGNVDGRSHLEREEENLRRRQEHQMRCLEEQRMKELDELRGCTFRPNLVKKLNSSPTTPRRPGSPSRKMSSFLDDLAMSVGSYSSESAMAKLQGLVEAQRMAHSKLQGLMQEEGPLKDRLRTLHGELHERIQREETNRVVNMLQDADAGSSSQKNLVQRVRQMVALGRDPETAQQQIVEELVLQSQDEVRRRVLEHFGPLRMEAEGELYSRQLAVAHELEAVEAKAMALRGGTLCEEAKSLGFDFGLASQVRQNLRSAPARRGSSVGSGSSMPRFNSAMSRVDSGLSQEGGIYGSPQLMMAMSNGSTAPLMAQAPSPKNKPDLSCAISPRSASPKELPAASSVTMPDSSPIRRLQQGQRVLLPNGLVAVALPAEAPMSPRQLMQMVQPTDSPRRAMAMNVSTMPSMVSMPSGQDSPRAMAVATVASLGQDMSPRRAMASGQLMGGQLSAISTDVSAGSPRQQAPLPQPPLQAGSPRRQQQSGQCQVVTEASPRQDSRASPRASAEAPRLVSNQDMSPRMASMASLASMGSYQAPSEGSQGNSATADAGKAGMSPLHKLASIKDKMSRLASNLQEDAFHFGEEPPGSARAEKREDTEETISASQSMRDPDAGASGTAPASIAGPLTQSVPTLAQGSPGLAPAALAQSQPTLPPFSPAAQAAQVLRPMVPAASSMTLPARPWTPSPGMSPAPMRPMVPQMMPQGAPYMGNAMASPRLPPGAQMRPAMPMQMIRPM